MKSIVRYILTLFAGGMVFALFHLIFETGLALTILFTVAALLGSYLLLAPRKIDPELEKMMKIYGISPGKIRSLVRSGRKKVSHMKRYNKKISDKKVQERIQRICETAEKIFKDIEKDPRDVKAAREFLNYHLDATLKIIKQYAALHGDSQDPSREKTLKKVEGLMGRIETAFEKQLSKLYDDDFLDLDTEISVLEKTIENKLR